MEDNLHAAASNDKVLVAGFFDDLVRCETRLYNALNDRLRQEHGIVTSQFEFLRYLRDHPACRVADLATTFAAGVGAISKGTDRLEARGWVRRVQNPGDRRSSLLELTADGADLVAAAEETFTEHISGLVGTIPLQAAAAALGTLRRALERDRVGTPVG